MILQNTHDILWFRFVCVIRNKSVVFGEKQQRKLAKNWRKKEKENSSEEKGVKL